MAIRTGGAKFERCGLVLVEMVCILFFFPLCPAINPLKVKCGTRVGLQVGPEVRERGPVVLAGGGGGVHGARGRIFESAKQQDIRKHAGSMY